MSLLPEDLVSRCIIYNRAFKSNVHIDELLFAFNASDSGGACHELGVLRRLAPANADVHRIGCGIANKQNERKSPPPLPGPDRRYYCGFRTATVRDLPVFGDGYSLRLILDGENGEPAHVDIALVVHEKDRSARATIKVDAGLAIAEAFGAAVEHICSSDAGDAHHPLIQFPDCLKGVGGSRLLSMQ